MMAIVQGPTRRSAIAGLAGLAIAPGLASSARAASGEPIRIGTVSQLTGALAIVGNEILTGVRIAVDQINQAGGLLGRPVEVLPRDDKSNPNEALAAAQSLIGAGAHFIVGPVTTANANAMLPAVKQGDALLVGPALAGMSLTHENYIPNFFRMSTNSWMNGNGMAEVMARTYPGVLNWGCVIPDQAFAHDYWAAFQTGIRRFVPQYSGGAQPRFSEPIQTKYGATDFKNELFKLSTSSTQGLMVALTGADGITFYSQMHGFGLGTRLKAIIDVAAELTLGRALKSNLPPNLWSYTPWFYGAEDQNDIGKKLIADYKIATGVCCSIEMARDRTSVTSPISIVTPVTASKNAAQEARRVRSVGTLLVMTPRLAACAWLRQPTRIAMAGLRSTPAPSSPTTDLTVHDAATARAVPGLTIGTRWMPTTHRHGLSKIGRFSTGYLGQRSWISSCEPYAIFKELRLHPVVGAHVPHATFNRGAMSGQI